MYTKAKSETRTETERKAFFRHAIEIEKRCSSDEYNFQ